MIGPLLMFDKSFLEMLNAEEVLELSMHFKFVGTPTLIGEIIADLKLEPSKRRLPSDVVKALSRKMQKVHGLQPANYRTLAIANIYAHEISMIGQVPVDGSAPNVHVTSDRRGVLYDSTPEQILWARWGNGEFESEDELTATTWRKGIEQIDLEGIAAIWKKFSSQHLNGASNQDELISALDVFLRDSAPAVQREILNMTLDLLRASAQDRRLANALMNIGEMRSVLEFAPYAGSVIRKRPVLLRVRCRSFHRRSRSGSSTYIATDSLALVRVHTPLPLFSYRILLWPPLPSRSILFLL